MSARTRLGFPLLAGLCLLLGAAIGAVRVGPSLAHAASPLQLSPTQGRTTVRVREMRALVNPGPITVPIEIRNARDVGAATMMVRYDPTLLQVKTCRRGRAFDGGICNPAFDASGDGTADTVRFNIVALEGVSTRAGQTLVLLEIAFEALRPGPVGTRIPLSLVVETFTDVDGVPIPVLSNAGGITFVDAFDAIFLPVTSKGGR